MARTKASVGAKVSSGKSSKARCCVAVPSTSSSSAGGGDRSSRNHSGGGNPVCPRETPKWQKPITNFFNTGNGYATDEVDDGVIAGSSKSRHNVIESDEESTITVEDCPSKSECSPLEVDEAESPERPKNEELDDSFELEPLFGENNYKIDDYFRKQMGKGKGKGKKTKDKENVDGNIKRNSTKRDLEDVTIGEEMHVSKKVKVDS